MTTFPLVGHSSLFGDLSPASDQVDAAVASAAASAAAAAASAAAATAATAAAVTAAIPATGGALLGTTGVAGAARAITVGANLTLDPATHVLSAAGGGSSGGGISSPGGTTGQVQFNSAGNLAGFTVGGDGTLNTATGALTVTKTNGTVIGSAATKAVSGNTTVVLSTSGTLTNGHLLSVDLSGNAVDSGVVAPTIGVVGSYTLAAPDDTFNWAIYDSGNADYRMNLPLVRADVLSHGGSFTKAARVTPVAVTYAATITIDASAGVEFRTTLTGNVIVANPNNLVDGTRIDWRFKQDATGGHTHTFGPKWKFNTTPTFVTTANAVNRVSGVYVQADDVIECVAQSGW